MHDRKKAAALDSVERVTEAPLLALSVAIIPLILAPLMFDFSPGVDRALLLVDWSIWAIFALELSVRTYLAPRRASYLARHWFDVIIVVVPFLRPLRILRSAPLLRALRAGRGVAFLARAIHAGRDIAGRHGLQYGLVVGVLLVFASAGAVTLAERNSGGNINDFGTALWWAATTVTTVGYGDTYPHTPEGRGIAVFLMLVGITLFGLLTASIAAYFVESNREDEPSLREIGEKLERLERLVQSLGERQARGLENTPPEGDQ